MNRTRQLNKVAEYMGNEVVVLLSPGVAVMIMLNNQASKNLSLKELLKKMMILT